MSESKGILVGYSGHAYVVAEAAILSGVKLIGYFEKEQKQRNPFAIPFLGSEQDALLLPQYVDKGVILPGIGDNKLRKKILMHLLRAGFSLATVVHPKSSISALAKTGNGSFVANGAIINAFAAIGNGCIVNTGAIVEHECMLRDYVHVAPGAVLAGNVFVEEGSFIGANAVVRQHIRIGKWATIGAGAVVVKDVPDHAIVVGNPAKELS